MLQRFRNLNLLLYLRYHRRTILQSPLSRTAVDNRSFFFGGNGEQSRTRCGNPKNCSKERGFHVGKQAETCVEVQISFVAREVLKWTAQLSFSFYGNGGTKFPKTAEQRFVHDFVIERGVASPVT